MRPNKHIDEVIKAKLENLEAGYDSNSWDMLAHRMDFEAQQAVDDFFKTRLEGIGTSIPPSSWDAFEKVLDANETAEAIEAEAQLDSIAYDKLHNLQVPYEDHHWALMARRLEEEFSIRHQLYRFKVAEMAVMALLLLTVIRFMPLMEKWLQSDPSSELLTETRQQQTAPSVETIAPISTQLNALKENNNIEGTTSADTETRHHLLKPTKSGHALIPSVSSVDPANVLKDHSLASNDGFQRSISKWTGLPINILPTKEIKPQPAPSESVARVEEITGRKIKQQQFLAKKKQADLDVVATLPIEKVNSNFAWEIPTIQAKPPKKKSDLRFSIFTTTDINYVTTPPDQISVFGEPVKTGYNETLASGYGGGVNVSWKRNRWEYQTGGIYSFKRYIPNTPIFIFETLNFYIKEDFNGIQLDIFQVPLNALYHFKNKGKWRFYASAGVSAHFVTSTIYEFDVEKEALNANEENNGSNRGSSPDETKSIKQQKDFPNGLLDGGNLQKNFYMSANIGLGAEYYLSPKWTIFFQPNYQHFMMSGGIGTNKDKIYTTSLQLGTKFNLK